MYLLNFFFIFIGKNFSDQAFFFFDSTTRREPIRKEQKRKKKKDIRENVDQLHNNVEL